MIGCRELTVRYPGVALPALEECRLHLQPGERSVLLGPSGAGKSTLLRCLAGLQRASTGTVCAADGVPPSGAAAWRRWRRGVALVQQEHALVPQRSALWHACTGALAEYGFWAGLGWWRREHLDRALRALDQVGLLERAGDPVARLSGGQRQRVAIARALVQEAPVMLADEPVASLDPGTAREVLDLVGGIVAAGRACLLSMHQPELALPWADRVIALRGGRIVHDGPPEACDQALLASLYATTRAA